MISLARFNLIFLIFITASIQNLWALDIQKVTSPGGIEAWLVESHSIPLISMGISFKGGSAGDAEGKEGLSKMVSGLLDEGAGDMDSAAFNTRLEQLAIKLSFSSGRDSFGGSLLTLSKNRDEAFRLFSLALTEPRFDAPAVERIRRQLQTLLIRKMERPSSIAGKIWREQAYADHPYGRSSDGTEESLKTLNREDLKNFMASRLGKDRLIVAVVGDINARELSILLDKSFSALPETSESVDIAEATAQMKTGVWLHAYPGKQSNIIFGHGGIKRLDPDWYTAYVMNYILGGGGLTSRLAETIREEKGLAYSVSTSFSPLEHGGLFIGRVGTQNAKAGEAMALIRDEIRKMAVGGVTDKELEDAKTYLTGSYALTFSTSGAIVGQMLGAQHLGFTPEYFDHRNDIITAVTKEKIAQAAEKLLKPDGLFWAVVGSPEKIEGFGFKRLDPR